MPNKYELIKIAENRYKIKATKSFITITGAKINVGQFGGEVGSPNVLSQEGRCWIFANVKLSENCIVDGNACIMHSSVAPDASVKLHGNVIVTKCKFDVCSEVELFSGNYKRTAFAGMFSGSININGTVSHCLFASKHTTTIEITSSGKQTIPVNEYVGVDSDSTRTIKEIHYHIGEEQIEVDSYYEKEDGEKFYFKKPF